MGITTTTNESKGRYYTAVLYPENMRPDWEEEIGRLLQYPGVYIIHNQDTTSKDEEDRKVHVHVMLAFSNTTTFKNALSIFRSLNAEGKEACPTCQKVHNVRFMYDYLIHDTEDSKKKGKHLYDKSERIEFNNFDIGAFEQISTSEKKAIRKELSKLIKEKQFTNFYDFNEYVTDNYSDEYLDVAHDDSAFFERLTRGLYLKRKISAETLYKEK